MEFQFVLSKTPIVDQFWQHEIFHGINWIYIFEVLILSNCPFHCGFDIFYSPHRDSSVQVEVVHHLWIQTVVKVCGWIFFACMNSCLIFQIHLNWKLQRLVGRSACAWKCEDERKNLSFSINCIKVFSKLEAIPMVWMPCGLKGLTGYCAKHLSKTYIFVFPKMSALWASQKMPHHTNTWSH